LHVLESYSHFQNVPNTFPSPTFPCKPHGGPK
jgi:hypothetical protein